MLNELQRLYSLSLCVLRRRGLFNRTSLPNHPRGLYTNLAASACLSGRSESKAITGTPSLHAPTQSAYQNRPRGMQTAKGKTKRPPAADEWLLLPPASRLDLSSSHVAHSPLTQDQNVRMEEPTIGLCRWMPVQSRKLRDDYFTTEDENVTYSICVKVEVRKFKIDIANLPAPNRAQNRENLELPVSESKNTLFDPQHGT